ncbi:hypothetical protein PVAND_004643 [Polypedilum vanderplanki]|uniref:cyclin-dependent kinase n=1 Tax=Polypedilum vanderplanki TaxID=319348 RepID=A0A9J6BYR1_POLVA|nr:hypothetical protein PVAND_004643 [Polypedilum vanderplanki]
MEYNLFTQQIDKESSKYYNRGRINSYCQTTASDNHFYPKYCQYHQYCPPFYALNNNYSFQNRCHYRQYKRPRLNDDQEVYHKPYFSLLYPPLPPPPPPPPLPTYPYPIKTDQSNTCEKDPKVESKINDQLNTSDEILKEKATNLTQDKIESSSVKKLRKFKSKNSNLLQRPSIRNKTVMPKHELQLRSFSSFKIIETIGEGTYGKVYRANDMTTSKNVALKLIRMEFETEGFPITSLREVIILRKLNHENIIQLLDIVYDTDKNLAFLVFEYMNNDLSGLLQNPEMIFNEKNIYQITRQLLNGLQFSHSQNVVHRDLKPANILINNKGEVKIADFGLARVWKPDRPFTNKVISLYYRPIELLMGETYYDFSCDMWSLGCIICELFKGSPLFPFHTEINVANAIFYLCGSPDVNHWKLTSKSKTVLKPKSTPRILKSTLSSYIPSLIVDLIDQMLKLNPKSRITATEALKSPWILKMEKSNLEPMKLPRSDSFEMKMRKKNIKGNK